MARSLLLLSAQRLTPNEGVEPINKVILILLAAVLTTIIAAKLAYEATSYTGSDPVNQPWVQNTMEFVAWNDQQWIAWIHDGAFEQIPQNEKDWSRHSNPTLAFTDWEGEKWQAKIDGDEFLLAHRGDWAGLVERTSAIQYRDWTGTNQLRTLVQLRR